MEPLFTLGGAANSLVTADLLLDHMTIEWSPESSNKKAQEINVHKYFYDYIQEAAIRTGLSSQCIQLFTESLPFWKRTSAMHIIQNINRYFNTCVNITH